MTGLEFAETPEGQFELSGRLDRPGDVVAAAMWAANEMKAGNGGVRVHFAPGDATSYRVAIVGSEVFVDGGFVVQSNGWLIVMEPAEGRNGYIWHPDNSGYTTAEYVAEHWNVDYHTSFVMAVFLHHLRAEFLS